MGEESLGAGSSRAYDPHHHRTAVGQASGSVLIMEGNHAGHGGGELLRCQLGLGSTRVLQAKDLVCVSAAGYSLSVANSTLLQQLGGTIDGQGPPHQGQ
jgi:hypothetical protein